MSEPGTEDVRAALQRSAGRVPIDPRLLARTEHRVAVLRRRRRGRLAAATTGLATVAVLTGVLVGLPGPRDASTPVGPATSTAVSTTPTPTAAPPTSSPAPSRTSTRTSAPTQPRWGQAQVDTFDTGVIDRARWTPYPIGSSGQFSTFAEKEATVVDGQLRLTVHRATGGPRYTTGGIGAIPLTRTYGRWVVRLRMTPGTGMVGQVLLVGADKKPTRYQASLTGDRQAIDIADVGAPGGPKNVRVTADVTRFRDLAVEWSPTSVRWTLDGQQVAEFRTAVARDPLWLAIQIIAADPDCGATPLNPACPGPLTLPQVLAVDRVSVQPYGGS